ncbi:MAG TPA: hypothetical protein VK611_05470 [Acidimicrobiales bacterium]|nr:hypothetical protein [Acidimicrobiales bacterium]
MAMRDGAPGTPTLSAAGAPPPALLDELVVITWLMVTAKPT